MLAQFLQFLFSGITVGATYALAALGFTLIYNASNVINFAQGEFIMLGGMLAVFFVQAGLPLPVAPSNMRSPAAMITSCALRFRNRQRPGCRRWQRIGLSPSRGSARS